MKKEKTIVLLIFIICFAIFLTTWFQQKNDNEYSDGTIVKPNVILETSKEFIASIESIKENFKEHIGEESKDVEESRISESDPVNEVPEEIASEVSNVLEQESYTIPITSRSADDYFPSSGEIIGTIRCNEINLYTSIAYGDSQSNIDNYDVTQQYNLQINSNANVLIAGHNYKSFAKLFNANIGNVLQIHTYYGDFNYRITAINYGTVTDDMTNILDENGNPLYDAYSNENKLILYTCGKGTNDRLVITAYPI